MKKIIFITIFTGIYLIGFGQRIDKFAPAHITNYGLGFENSIIEKTTVSPVVSPKPMRHVNKKNKNSDVVTKYYIASSGNIYTLLTPSSTYLTANQETNTIMFTHRGNPSVGLGTVSDIINSFSTDGGVNWKQINVTAGNPNANRYPSGVIYNPIGNSTPSNAYSVIAGPSLDANTKWTINYFGSAKLDSTDIKVDYVPQSTVLQNFPRINLTSCDDGSMHVMGYSYWDVVTDKLVWKGAVMNNGTFDDNARKITWTNVPIVHDFYKQSFTTFNSAWSQDGSIGYVYFLGIDSIKKYPSYMPIVHKTTDGGKTWDTLPNYDFSNLTSLTSKLWRTHLADTISSHYHKTIPYFSGENDAVVDANGDLHIFGIIYGRFNENIDSSNYIYKYEPYKLFDVYTTSGGWGADFLDTITSKYVAAAESGYGSGSDAVGWDHRIQASRTQDGKKVFVVWTDTDTLEYGIGSNFYPEIKAYGKDVITGLKTGPKNFTKDTYYSEDNYWHTAGDITLKDGNKYRIPVTTTRMALDPADSVAHFFVDGIFFSENEFVTNPVVHELSKPNSSFISVSQNYPNPFTDNTSFKVNVNKASALSIDVRNLLGQTVYQIPVHYVSAGEHKIIINSKNLTSGIYFYTVKADKFSITKKMIVKL